MPYLPPSVDDTMTDSDSAPMGGWSNISGTGTISSDASGASGDIANTCTASFDTTYNDDHQAIVEATTIDTAAGFGIFLRMSNYSSISTADGYLCIHRPYETPNRTIVIQRIDNGSGTDLAETDLTMSDTDRMWALIDGTAIEMRIDTGSGLPSSADLSTTDSTYSTGDTTGLFIYDVNYELQDFGASNLLYSAPDTRPLAIERGISRRLSRA